ncbi:hypothetical protein [Desulfosarcina ovata]|uniref:Uncharacterized protein n=1 Tax=Desulfosarcina ovata subsp. ovata TaxID=2752305 RepID=A0A5K8AKA3_9BACT|nr:hypothetical protein [Desulfosarcina ovata]BBO92926.1 hypothetical protein DSCOOX_61060 [Desulfosarcina ovata subsp. ovata]
MYLVAHVLNPAENEKYVGCAIITVDQALVDKARRSLGVLDCAGPDLLYAIFEDRSPVFLLNPDFNMMMHERSDDSAFLGLLDDLNGKFAVVDALPLPLEELKRRYGLDVEEVSIGVNQHQKGAVIWEAKADWQGDHRDEFYTVWVDVDNIEAELAKAHC